MKPFRITIALLLVLCTYSLVLGAEQPSSRWGNLIDVAYKFSWYPKKDLQDLLKKKSDEYGKSLEEYVGLLKEELTEGATETGLITADSFVYGKDWTKYSRLAVAQFCLFLSNDDGVHLKNAKTALSVLSGKMELSNIAFWNYLFQAYIDLEKKDRDAFVSSVFQIWQNVILQLEAEDVFMMGSKNSKTEFVRNLNFLYENLAHLIITRAIIEETTPDLYPLGVIIRSLRDKLTSENGYKNIVESLVERMHGLKSDNSNLNFAVAFVEATASQYEFEDEKSEALVASKYNLTHIYYGLALSWADTLKGRAAILTQRMGFASYIIRRLIDEDNLLSKNKLFKDLPSKSSQLVKEAFSLYDQLSQPTVQNNGFINKGFNKKSNYFTAMQQLWDSSAKLLMMQSAYYKSIRKPDKPEDFYMAESPLLQYLSFFKRYAGENSELVPDNAFYLAAYSAKELGDLYSEASKFSTRIEIHDLAFAYQLQAVELFPMDIMSILQLAHHTNQEGRLNRYLQKVGPVALRFRNSKIASTWPDNHSSDYNNCVSLVKDIIPEIIDKGYFMVKFLQQSGGKGSGDELYFKAVVMTRLLMATKRSHSEEAIENALSSIAKQNFTDESVNGILNDALPADMHDVANSIPGIEVKYRFSSLKNELYGSMNNSIHSYLRELYYENAGS